MFFFVWSAKGGSGTTVTSICLAASVAKRSTSGVLLVDLAGDAPMACGRPTPRWGVTDWLATTEGSSSALSRLEIEMSTFSLLAAGSSESWSDARVDDLVLALASDGRHVVVDAGVIGVKQEPSTLDRLKQRLLVEADRSVLVTRACYLGLRRAASVAQRIDVVVLVREAGRELDRAQVGRSLSVDLVVEVDYDPMLSRLVDSGRLLDRDHRVIDRALRKVA